MKSPSSAPVQITLWTRDRHNIPPCLCKKRNLTLDSNDQRNCNYVQSFFVLSLHSHCSYLHCSHCFFLGNIPIHHSDLGQVVRSMVSANHLLGSIKINRLSWYLTLVRANQASSNSALEAACPVAASALIHCPSVSRAHDHC